MIVPLRNHLMGAVSIGDSINAQIFFKELKIKLVMLRLKDDHAFKDKVAELLAIMEKQRFKFDKIKKNPIVAALLKDENESIQQGFAAWTRIVAYRRARKVVGKQIVPFTGARLTPLKHDIYEEWFTSILQERFAHVIGFSPNRRAVLWEQSTYWGISPKQAEQLYVVQLKGTKIVFAQVNVPMR